MTINELIEVLQSIADEREDFEVNVATQPSYPLAFELENVVIIDGTVWLALGDHTEDPYGVPAEVWEF